MNLPLQHFVVLGDSVSAGIGDPVAGVPAASAFDVVAAALQHVHPAMLYTNLAERGLLIAEVRERQLEAALSLRPGLVSVIAGGNDILKGLWDVQNYEAQLEAMLAAFTARQVQVITATWFNPTLHRSLPAEQRSRLVSQLQEGNEVTRRLSQQYGTLLVEFWEQSIGGQARFWSQDGKHPNALGYREIAAQLLAALEQRSELLASRPRVGGTA
jgi:lysophospholipase L1-like esterase